MIYCGAEHIICPLGGTAEQVFTNAKSGRISIMNHDVPAISAETFHASMFDTSTSRKGLFCQRLVQDSIKSSMEKCTRSLLRDDRTLLILSTTKGDVDLLEEDEDHAGLSGLLASVVENLGFTGRSIVVSNACISGLLSVITGADLIHSGAYDNVIVCGVDLVSKFTVRGFQSLYALDNKPCRPYDQDRKGINIGEGAGVMVMSNDAALFDRPFLYQSGACANDANHISGPSRTGEGLYRAIEKCLATTTIDRLDLDQISAHGTATIYNDEMESIALTRSGLQDIPVHSYKGYFGHTLGAAGIIELSLLFQSVRNEVILPTAGFENNGTSETISVTDSLISKPSFNILKTASGFGGCNAAAAFRYEHN